MELMVAVAIGLFLVAVSAAIYLGSKALFQSQNALARLQETGRFAVDALADDLRVAGFRGCLAHGRSTAFRNTLNSPSGALFDFGNALLASRHNGAGWAPALDPAISSLTPAPSPTADVITLRRPASPGFALVAEMASATAPLTVGGPAPFAKGDLLLVADCGGAVALQASSVTTAAGTVVIDHVPGTGLSPGMSTASLGRAFLQDAAVYRMKSVTYYLAPSARPGKAGVMSLWVFSHPSYLAAAQPEELVTGVERMAISLGVDDDGDLNADTYVAPHAVANWSKVLSARVELLLASPEDAIATAPQKYVFDGATYTPADRRLRTVVSLASSLRNSVP